MQNTQDINQTQNQLPPSHAKGDSQLPPSHAKGDSQLPPSHAEGGLGGGSETTQTQQNINKDANNKDAKIKVSTIAKTRKIYSRHGSEYVEKAFIESAKQKQPWHLRKNQHDLKANLETTYHAPSDRAFWTFESFKESGEFVSPDNDGNGTLALVFLRGGDGKKHREYHRHSENHYKHWGDGNYVEYRTHMVHIGIFIEGRMYNNRNAYLQRYYAKDIQNGEPSSFGEYKTVLGGLSNNGIYAMRLRAHNKARNSIGYRSDFNSISHVAQLADIYTSEPTRGEEGFVIVKLKPNQVVPITVGSGGEVVVNYINCIKDYKGNIVNSNNASVNNIIAHIPVTKADVNKRTLFKVGKETRYKETQDINQDVNSQDVETQDTQTQDINQNANNADVETQDTQTQQNLNQDVNTQDIDYDTYTQNQLQQDTQQGIATIEKNTIDIRRYVNYKKQLWIDTYKQNQDAIDKEEFDKKLKEYEMLIEEILMRKKIFHGNMAITTQEYYSNVNNINDSISLLEKELEKASGYTKDNHKNLRLKDALISTQLQEYEQLQTAYLTILATHKETFIATITTDIGEKYANDANIPDEIKIKEAVYAKKKTWIYLHRYGLATPQAIQNHNNTLKQYTNPK